MIAFPVDLLMRIAPDPPAGRKQNNVKLARTADLEIPTEPVLLVEPLLDDPAPADLRLRLQSVINVELPEKGFERDLAVRLLCQ